uniref:Zinc finger translocation associated n=1 Tax=Labrus bergylta TaxID=56723 RepID=A0A3Q3G341_9LABR
PTGASPSSRTTPSSSPRRIPGRDHRRYYHEYWRSEYLMDFDPQRHGMICMVCGSSLATLKLSTIKRHIRQKHPDSLLWSAEDKEVIRSGWESHLSVGGALRSFSSAETPSAQEEEEEEQQEEEQHAAGGRSLPRDQDLPGPSAQTLERYLNDSLHAWFRQEFLMEYEAVAGRLLCMVCGGELPSLHLEHIKSHVLDTHPNSLVYSSEEKHCILQAWAQTHGEDTSLEMSIKSEADTKEAGAELFSQEVEAVQVHDTCLIGEDGGVGAPQQGPPPPRQPRKRRLRGGDPWRLRLDYLVAYGPAGRGTFCMVCSQVLHETKVSSFRRHIQENHPDTTSLSRQEREAMAAAWTKDYSGEGSASGFQKGVSGNVAPNSHPLIGYRKEKRESEDGGETFLFQQLRFSLKRKTQKRRNYQLRWRMEYLMEYDSRRHGLICMVCGATLATLKVSTIKRHIQQVHAHSLDYNPEEKQQALLSYNQTALNATHPDDLSHS